MASNTLAQQNADILAQWAAQNPGGVHNVGMNNPQAYHSLQNAAANINQTAAPFDSSKPLWEQATGYPIKEHLAQDPRNLSSYFENPMPAGIAGFTSGQNYGKQVVSDLYNTQDAKDIWSRLQNESNQGLDASSMASIKAKYGSQGVTEQAKIQKSGLKGMAALHAGSDLDTKKREEAAAMDAAIKKQAFNTMRDEWGRRSLMAVNTPMAYGQLGSAASLGQTMSNLAGQPLNVSMG